MKSRSSGDESELAGACMSLRLLTQSGRPDSWRLSHRRGGCDIPTCVGRSLGLNYQQRFWKGPVCHHIPRALYAMFFCAWEQFLYAVLSRSTLCNALRVRALCHCYRRCGGTTAARPSFRVSSRITLTDRATVLLGPCHNPLSSGTSCASNHTALDLSSTVKRISYRAASRRAWSHYDDHWLLKRQPALDTSLYDYDMTGFYDITFFRLECY
ncbi:hypothetical protein V8E53_014903 [Lactarius tabidus]